MIAANLRRRSTRTTLTMLGIAVGVAAVVALSVFGEGFATGFAKTFSPTRADLVVSQRDATMVFTSALDESLREELAQLPGVERVDGTIVGLLQMAESPYFVVKGEEPKGFTFGSYRIVEGQPLTGRRQVILGKTAAASFDKRMGDTFRIQELTFRVVGIYENGVALEDGGAVISLADAQSAFDRRGQVSYYSLRLKDPGRTDEVKRLVETRFSGAVAARSGEPTTQTEMLQLYRSFGWFLCVFAVVVGGLGMMNSSLMSVFERTREIGVLRAIGWRRQRVVGLILGESLALAVGGGVLGILFGSALTLVAQLVPAVEMFLRGVFTPATFLQALVVALLLGAVGGLYPAWRAAQLPPVEAMRHEGGSSGSLGVRTAWLVRRVGNGPLRDLLRRPTRSLLSAAAIGVGIGSVITLTTFADGLEQAFVDVANAGEADLVVEQAGVADVAASSIDERVVDRIRLNPEVASAAGVVLKTTSQPDLAFLIVFGIDPRDEYLTRFRIREGRLIQRPREVMIGRTAATGLDKRVGDRLRLAGSSYAIVGIYENGLVFEDTAVTMPLEDAQQLFGQPRRLTLLAVRAKDQSQVDDLARSLGSQFPELAISKTTQVTERMQDFASLRAVLHVVTLVTAVVGGIVMTNAMLMSVFERTQEIGVLRAVGWRRRSVVRMVLGESLVLGGISILIGSLFGVALTYAFTLEPILGRFIRPTFTPQLFLEVGLLAVVLTTVGGLYPAWRASGLRPIEALRQE